MEDLIIRSLQRRTTAEEDERLRAWRESAWENEQAYTALAELWSLMGVAASSRESEPSTDVDVIIARAEAEARAASAAQGQDASVTALDPAGRTQPRVHGRARWVRRAVVVGPLAASLAAAGFGLGVLSSGLIRPSESLAYSEVTTGAGESATVTFSDNTAVRLGPSSNLRMIEGGDNPVVRLEGRAFFGIVPDPSRTFTVQTRFGDAVALGTRFEVRTDEEEFRVLVVQGNVRVSSGGSSVDLREGVLSRNVEGAPPSTSSVEDVDTHLDWIGQALVWRATPLSRVISEIERRYGATVELEDESLGGVTVTATFTDQPVGTVLFVVCEIVGADCTFDDDRFRVGDLNVSALPLRPPSTAAPARTP